jgi:hypothetical protein
MEFSENKHASTPSVKSDDLTIHSACIDNIYDIPIDQIVRPLPSVLDQSKVESLINTLQVNF